jgi:hypothetical protein
MGPAMTTAAQGDEVFLRIRSRLQGRVKLVLANDQAETIAERMAIAVGGLDFHRRLLFLVRRRKQARKRSELLDRANADTVRLAQGTVDGTRFGNPHLGTLDAGRDIGGIGIAISYESFATG